MYLRISLRFIVENAGSPLCRILDTQTLFNPLLRRIEDQIFLILLILLRRQVDFHILLIHRDKILDISLLSDIPIDRRNSPQYTLDKNTFQSKQSFPQPINQRLANAPLSPVVTAEDGRYSHNYQAKLDSLFRISKFTRWSMYKLCSTGSEM